MHHYISQIVPLYFMDILRHLPGDPGMFLSCVVSGSLIFVKFMRLYKGLVGTIGQNHIGMIHKQTISER